MANKKLFGSAKTNNNRISITNTVNNAGGVAYSQSDENALAQLVCTGTLNNTYYVSGEEQLKKIKELSDKVSSEFLAKCAVYGHKKAHMKDTPTLLLAKLAARGDIYWLKKAFPIVITNQKMLRNFAQIVRSGAVGRKSFGTAVKKIIQDWLSKQSGNALFKGAVGNNPSLADVVKMVHPKPESKEKEAFYAWLLDKKEYNKEALPSQVKLFELFKKNPKEELPACDFRMLTPFLTDASWTKVALKMPWNALRMNLNTFQRHNVFNDNEVVQQLAAKLSNKEEVLKNNAFPYQLLTMYQAIAGKVPAQFSLAAEQAMEHATLNTPKLNKRCAALLDTSGSMNSPVTGARDGATSVTTCRDVGALFASCILRQNEGSIVVPFDTCVHLHNLNADDSVMQNATKLSRFGGGGTDCACALRKLNDENWKGDVVVYFSDNESWYGATRYGYGRTGVAEEWAKFKNRNPKAKLICLDLIPNTTSQIPNLPSEVLNIGGFSDDCFSVIERFVNGENLDFASVIKEVQI